MDFILENIVWFIAGGFVLIMTIIGYYAEKTDFTKNKEKKKKKSQKITKTDKVDKNVDITKEIATDLLPKEQLTNNQSTKVDDNNIPISNIVNDKTDKEKEIVEENKDIALNTIENSDSILNKETDSSINTLEIKNEIESLPNQNVDIKTDQDLGDDTTVLTNNVGATDNVSEIEDNNSDIQENISTDTLNSSLENLEESNNIVVNSFDQETILNNDKEIANDINNSSQVILEEQKEIESVENKKNELTDLIDEESNNLIEEIKDEAILTTLTDDELKEDYNNKEQQIVNENDLTYDEIEETVVNDNVISEESVVNDIINIDKSLLNEEEEEEEIEIVEDNKVLNSMDVEIPIDNDKVVNIDDITSNLLNDENEDLKNKINNNDLLEF